jgi:hypothetical protein
VRTKFDIYVLLTHVPSHVFVCKGYQITLLKLVVRAQTSEMMHKCIPPVSKMLTLTYNQENRVIIK